MTVADDATGRRTESATRLPREERRAQVLTAARQVFVAQGYHTTGMDDIAERAGVSKPVLYQHFPGKFDLYLALLDEGIASLIDALREALEATADNKQRVRGAVSAYFAFIDDPDGAFRLVFESDLTNEIAVRERIEASDDVCASLLGQVIAEDTALPIPQAELLASGLLGMAEIAARRWLRDGASRIPREDAVELIASLGWRGIRGFPLSHPPQAT
ncbi:MAG: TetR/AcrR family transcriptional regulator [Candidatus Nanopelagicales bacterium]|jgi:AcrR family transcriptional regulator